MPFPVRLSDHLRSRERVVLHAADAVACAVLLPLIPAGPDFDLVYTLRTDHLPSHKGQVAFPGGKRAADEALVDTALRESAEEIGIDPRDVQVLGCLDDVFTMATQFVITPWVGLLPSGYRFRPNPHEVADVFTVTLSDLRDPRYHASQTKQWAGNEYQISAITAGRHEIWGATYTITMNFLERIAELENSARTEPERAAKG
ncbi:MAG: CoA pyrophosphatase [Deltaproteobacteria bacterium]|nr:CoA pyrophosphatase [Deltaproteobacteria bacterium]